MIYAPTNPLHMPRQIPQGQAVVEIIKASDSWYSNITLTDSGQRKRIIQLQFFPETHDSVLPIIWRNFFLITKI